MTPNWEDQMISEAQEYAMELVLLLLMLTAILCTHLGTQDWE